MKVLLLGSGGREHALAWRISQSPRLDRLWVAEGNAGTARLATNLPVDLGDTVSVVETARSLGVDLVVVGPELPLANGVVDRLAEAGIRAFGPTQAAARIESSKGFARTLMQEAGVHGPCFRVFQDEQKALGYLSTCPGPTVVKADGLAAGKGVMVCPTAEEASAAVRRCMTEGAFGAAGKTVVIEEFLTGQEVSVFAFTDGETISPLVAASDYKQVGEGDVGPNTGGMGSYTPPEFWNEGLAEEVKGKVIAPVLRELAARGTPYRGVLYAGLMLTKKGIQTLEFNCRFGDPEAQVILPLLESDPLEVMLACAQGTLDQVPVSWRSQAHVAVVMTSGGYPGEYPTGCRITGLEAEIPSSIVFHAGTRQPSSPSGESLLKPEDPEAVVTSGGRVLTVVGWGDNLADARSNAYRRLGTIHFDGCYYRKDIGSTGIGEILSTVEKGAWLPKPVPQNP